VCRRTILPALRRPLPLVLALVSLQAAVAGAGTSTQQNPSVTFASAGSKTVTLRACNALGCSTVTRQVVVLDPVPAVTSATLGASTLQVGANLTMSGAATGRPPLAYSWEIRSGATLVTTVTGAAATLATGALSPGGYTATLRVTNAQGSAASAALPFTLQAATATSFYALPPCRLLDTRAGWPLFAGLQRPITVAGACGIPTSALAIAGNVTAVTPTQPGFLVLFPAGQTQPLSATVTFGAGQTRSNNVVVPVTAAGLIAVAGIPGGEVHLVVDVTGYFAP
jgi:hypothetical protein